MSLPEYIPSIPQFFTIVNTICENYGIPKIITFKAKNMIFLRIFVPSAERKSRRASQGWERLQGAVRPCAALHYAAGR